MLFYNQFFVKQVTNVIYEVNMKRSFDKVPYKQRVLICSEQVEAWLFSFCDTV